MRSPILLSRFGDWLSAHPDSLPEWLLANVLPWLTTALTFFLLVVFLARYLSEGFLGKKIPRLTRESPREELKLIYFDKRPVRGLAFALCMFLLSRVIWLCATDIYLHFQGWSPIFGKDFTYYINKWDTVNYTRIAQYWYGFEDHGIDGYIKEYTIAFLPGYPLLIKALTYLVGDYVASGLILSNLFTIGSGMLLYALVSDSENEACARRACFFFFFSIGACAFSATHSESTMFFLTLLSVYLARKRRFVPAVLVGAYCAFTRQFGLFAAIPVYFEMLRYCAETGQELSAPKRAARWAGYALLTCGMLTGYGAYLLINRAIYGSPFAFLTYQRLNWGNELVPIWDCVRIVGESFCDFLRSSERWDSILGIFVPELVMALALPLLFLGCARRGNAGDNAYAWSYFLLTFSSSWLISGIRYTAAMYPVYIMLAQLTSKKSWRFVIYPLAILLYLYYNIMYCAEAMVV